MCIKGRKPNQLSDVFGRRKGMEIRGLIAGRVLELEGSSSSASYNPSNGTYSRLHHVEMVLAHQKEEGERLQDEATRLAQAVA